VARKLNTDLVLLGVTLALFGFGLVMVWSASSALAQESHGSPYYFLLKQVAWGTVGLVGLVLALRLDYKKLRRPGVVYPLLIASTLLLIVVLFLPSVNGTHRWIRLGALSFQPAELAKLSIVLFLAYHIERRAERINELVTLFPALLLVSWFGFLILIQQDLGTAFCLVLTCGVMLFAAGVRLKYFAALAVPALLVLYAAVMAVPWRRVRFESFFNPWADPQGAGYHVIQSLIAVGTGGVTGVGLMEGQQKHFYLPYPYSDFIYAVIGEELGLLGASAVVAGFVFFLWRGLRTAWRARQRRAERIRRVLRTEHARAHRVAALRRFGLDDDLAAADRQERQVDQPGGIGAKTGRHHRLETPAGNVGPAIARGGHPALGRQRHPADQCRAARDGSRCPFLQQVAPGFDMS
jgi:cell division protein FtsW